MPIKVEEFDRGRINLADYVLQVFREMPNLAFTEAELVDEVRVKLGGLVFDQRDLLRTLALMQAGGTNNEQGSFRPGILGAEPVSEGPRIGMPIARRNFDLGILPDVEKWMVSLYTYLIAHQGEAFEHQELRRALPTRFDAPGSFQAGLEGLLERGAITLGYVSGERYYAYAHALNTETWEPE
ncbi:MAG: hypothetical protein IIA54_09120, partial [Chloroflexi bacterium]|nr:hypothetical protein [Chloroflexota bacterium]